MSSYDQRAETRSHPPRGEEWPLPGAGPEALSNLSGWVGFYIARSVAIWAGKGDPVALWSRSPGETEEIVRQAELYRRLRASLETLSAKAALPTCGEPFERLVDAAAFDLDVGHIGSFAAFRFLYERLLPEGLHVSLCAVFAAAAAQPHRGPGEREALLLSLERAAYDCRT